ncbi:hypothetical protein C8R43DRAFT_46543 [Mycena crocata]|nr:hypothetical protein C8R43DRAFT_46543 [Mycena crocata]
MMEIRRDWCSVSQCFAAAESTFDILLSIAVLRRPPVNDAFAEFDRRRRSCSRLRGHPREFSVDGETGRRGKMKRRKYERRMVLEHSPQDSARRSGMPAFPGSQHWPLTKHIPDVPCMLVREPNLRRIDIPQAFDHGRSGRSHAAVRPHTSPSVPGSCRRRLCYSTTIGELPRRSFRPACSFPAHSKPAYTCCGSGVSTLRLLRERRRH